MPEIEYVMKATNINETIKIKSDLKDFILDILYFNQNVVKFLQGFLHFAKISLWQSLAR